MLKPVKKRTLCEEILDQCKHQIMCGNWKPGDRLPTERALSEYWGVSRTSVREAMSALAAIGLIDVRAGEGAFLTSEISPVFKQNIASKFLITKGSLLEVVEARKIIETQLVFLAAERATREDLDKMARLMDTMNDRIRKGAVFIEHDVDFHVTIASAAKNTILFETINAVRELFKSIHNETVLVPNMAENSIRQHQEIYEALKARDGERAKIAMEAHLDNVADVIREMKLDEQ